MSYKRVVCLTPSITETVFSLGAGDLVVGVTDACDFPHEVNSKTHVCSWFDPDMERLNELNPDLVLGLKSAHGRFSSVFVNYKIHCELFNPITIGDVLADILTLGDLLGVEDTAQFLVNSLLRRLEKLDKAVELISPNRRLTVSRILDIGEDELIAAGPQSFQYDVIARAGGINVTSSFDAAYPKVTFQQFKKWDPEMIFICGSDKSYLSRLNADKQWQSLRAVENNRLYQFDCGLTCRTSPRIIDMAELLFQTLYGKEIIGREPLI
ncbi:MAG: helical backbone metal receptor [Desulforhopalus sp.]